jgi:uncharacterized damage-inducible protein DinB
MNQHTALYLQKNGLATTPVVMTHLLAGVTEAELDTRYDPDRFTLREVVCHLADWEEIWLERMQRIVRENQPPLASYDEGQMAIENDYARQDFDAAFTRFVARRDALLAFLAERTEEDWNRLGIHSAIGSLTLGDLATLVLAHDGYHVRQIVEFRKR